MKKETADKAKKVAGRSAEVLGAATVGAASTMAANAMTQDDIQEENILADNESEGTIEAIDNDDMITEETVVNADDIMIDENDEDYKITEAEPITDDDTEPVEPDITIDENGDVIIDPINIDDTQLMYGGPEYFDPEPIDVEPDMYGGPVGDWDNEDPENLIAGNSDFGIMDDIINV